jgi:hypothetical protein
VDPALLRTAAGALAVALPTAAAASAWRGGRAAAAAQLRARGWSRR